MQVARKKEKYQILYESSVMGEWMLWMVDTQGMTSKRRFAWNASGWRPNILGQMILHLMYY